MSNSIEDLKKEIEDRISGHRPSDPFEPDVTYKQSQLPSGERVVNYYVDLPREDRSEYVNSYYDSDKAWVEGRGDDYDLTATLFCEWQV